VRRSPFTLRDLRAVCRACFVSVIPLLGLVSGCGDSAAIPPDAPPDIPPDSLPDASTTRVTVRTGTPPALLAFRDGPNPWQVQAVAGISTFDLAPTGPYEVVVACEDGSGVDMSVQITLLARTLGDGPEVDSLCSFVHPFVVSGTVIGAGRVAFGNRGVGRGGVPEWSFELPTAAGSFDLVAVSQGVRGVLGNIAIRRDIEIAADRSIGTIDPMAEGSPLVPVTLELTNLGAGETTSVLPFVTSGNTVTSLTEVGPARPAGLEAKLAPASVLRPTDFNTVTITAAMPASGTPPQIRSRAVRRTVRPDDLAAMTLPDPLGPVVFEASPERLTAAWSTLPNYATIGLSRDGFVTGFTQRRFHFALLTRSFIEVTGATRATIDFRDVPGFKTEWLHAPTVTQRYGLTATLVLSASESAFSSASEVIVPAAAVEEPAR
jgi:hypothetical protein